MLSGICTASTPPGFSPAEQPLQHRQMIRHPLEGGVGIEQVGVVRRGPMRQVGLHELALRQPLARLPQHVGRGIDSGRFRRPESAPPEARSNCRGRSRGRRLCRALASGTCASRSRAGRVRSSSNFRYCCALQSAILLSPSAQALSCHVRAARPTSPLPPLLAGYRSASLVSAGGQAGAALKS